MFSDTGGLGKERMALYLATLQRANTRARGWRFSACPAFCQDIDILTDRGLVTVLDRGEDFIIAEATKSGRALVENIDARIRAK